MASRGVLLVAFLSFALLPLLVSAFFPGFPGIVPGGGFNPNPPQHQGGQWGDGGPIAIGNPVWPWLTVLPDPKQPEDPEPEQPADPEQPVDPEQPEDPQLSEPEPEPEPKPKPEPKPEEGLRVGFYKNSCPQAEKVIYQTLQKNFRKDPRYAAAVLRLIYHDCFVTGCDASVLLDTTPTGEEVEKKADLNGPHVRGFDVIDDIKTNLEAECPGVVSCADIISYATRDSLVSSGVPTYVVAGGRRDGLASLAKNVPGNLPRPDSSAEDNIRLFQRKGLSLEDLVVLVGAHSIGTAHCNVVSPRFHDPVKSKEIDPGYMLKMQTLAACMNDSQDLAFDSYSAHKMDSHFYKELLARQALLESDHNLAKEPRSRNLMQKFVDDQNGWLAKFTAAIKKLGEVEVLTGNKGEIRKQCRAVNIK